MHVWYFTVCLPACLPICESVRNPLFSNCPPKFSGRFGQKKKLRTVRRVDEHAMLACANAQRTVLLFLNASFGACQKKIYPLILHKTSRISSFVTYNKQEREREREREGLNTIGKIEDRRREGSTESNRRSTKGVKSNERTNERHTNTQTHLLEITTSEGDRTTQHHHGSAAEDEQQQQQWKKKTCHNKNRHGDGFDGHSWIILL